MKIKYLSLPVIALSMALSYTPSAFACHNICEHKHNWRKISEQLTLSADQNDKIKALNEKTKTDIKTKYQELKDIRMKINDAFRNNDMSDTKVDSFATQEQQVMGAILKIRLQERYDTYKLLDDKQKEKMNGMVKKWEEKHHDKHTCTSD